MSNLAIRVEHLSKRYRIGVEEVLVIIVNYRFGISVVADL